MKILKAPEIPTGEELRKQRELAQQIRLQTMKEYPQTLKNKLNEYSGDVLSDDFIRYLNALINLEENLLKNKDISDKRVELLESIKFLKNIVTYNVFGCAKRTLQSAGVENLQDFYCDELKLSAGMENKALFGSNFSDPIHPYFEIHTLIESAERREKRLEELKEELEKEKAKTNPHKDWGKYYEKPSRKVKGKIRMNYFATDFDRWNADHKQKIQQLEEAIQQLEERRALSVVELAYSRQSQKVAEAFQNEYGITDCGEEMEYQGGIIIGQRLVKRNFGTICIKRSYH